jgi:hypothetical protein
MMTVIKMIISLFKKEDINEDWDTILSLQNYPPPGVDPIKYKEFAEWSDANCKRHGL